jgi:protein dithiol oxidoreductase (disulfide-forming)
MSGACDDPGAPMRRREFSATLLGAGAAALARPGAARAQGGPVEGRHYLLLNPPVPTGAGPGKIELIEFFWYGCPHCNAFEPELEPWVRQLPADVVFHRVPVAFRPEPYVAHQRIYYALDGLGLLGTMHRKVFHAIHSERLRLDKPADIAAFVARNGVDATQFMDAFNSFTTQSRLRQANQLVDAYKVDGVPAIGIHGRFYTSGPLAGSNEKSLAVTDWLVQRLRKTS